MGNKVEEARNKAVEDHTAGTRAKQAKEVKTTKKMPGKSCIQMHREVSWTGSMLIKKVMKSFPN